MSPVEPCPNPECRKPRHRWPGEPASQLCLTCRLNVVENTHVIEDEEDKEVKDR